MKALFDLDFKRFITPSIIKFVYVLVIVAICVFYIVAVVGAFTESAGMGFLVLLVLGPLGALIYLVLVRAGLESLVAQIRTAQNTTELVRLAGGNPPVDGGYRPGPNGPSSPQNPANPTISHPTQRPATQSDKGNTPPANPYQK